MNISWLYVTWSLAEYCPASLHRVVDGASGGSSVTILIPAFNTSTHTNSQPQPQPVQSPRRLRKLFHFN